MDKKTKEKFHDYEKLYSATNLGICIHLQFFIFHVSG